MTVELFFCSPESIRDAELLRSYERLLAPDERQAYASLRVEERRHEYLVTRAAICSLLARRLRVSPQELRFDRDELGKPRLASPHAGRAYFNLSHTRGLLACALSDSEVGVDVEAIDTSFDVVSIATRFFSARETRWLEGRPETSRALSFFDLWVLKEAYIKALGTGLREGLRHFSFLLGEDETISFLSEAKEKLLEEDRRWSFALFRLDERYRAAVAWEQGSAFSAALRAYSHVPLGEISPMALPLHGASPGVRIL